MYGSKETALPQVFEDLAESDVFAMLTFHEWLYIEKELKLYYLVMLRPDDFHVCLIGDA